MGLRAPELLIILVVALLIFGPKNLPKLGKSLGQTVKNVREGMESDDEDEEEEEEEVVEDDEDEDEDEDDEDADVEPEPAPKKTAAKKKTTAKKSTKKTSE